MSTHEDFEQWMAEQSGWNPYPDLREAWQAATALRDAEIAQLKAERDALAEQLRVSRQSEREAWRYKEDLTLKDAERLDFLAANIEWDGYGHWLPEFHIELREHASNRDCLNAAIDAAMASNSKGGK